MRLVGLAGKAGSGKNHIAREILAKLDGFVPLAMAGPMKARLVASGDIPAEEATGQVPKSDDTRQTLQDYGNTARAMHGESFWISQIEWWLSWFITEAAIHDFVITDIRTKEEVEWVHSLGGVVIRITGRGGLEGPLGDDITETNLDDLTLPSVDNSQDANLPIVKDRIRSIIEDHYS